MGELYEQYKDRSNGILIFLKRDVNLNITVGLSVQAENPFDNELIMHHFHTVLVQFLSFICIISDLLKLIKLKFPRLSNLVKVKI